LTVVQVVKTRKKLFSGDLGRGEWEIEDNSNVKGVLSKMNVPLAGPRSSDCWEHTVFDLWMLERKNERSQDE